MGTLWQDVAYAVRRLWSNRLFSLVVILMLALGIGVNSGMFSLVNALLLRPLPYGEPERLVALNHHYPSLDLVTNVSVRGFLEYRDTISAFERVAATAGWVTNLTGVGQPERLTGGRVSHDYLQTLGVRPALGRDFRPEEDVHGAHHVVIVSHGFWQGRLGGDPGVVGRKLDLNGEAHEIIGVMPAGFRDFFGRTRQLWRPLALPQEWLENRSVINEWLSIVAMLRRDMPIDAARQQLAVTAAAFKQEQGDVVPDNWEIAVATLDERARSGYRSSLILLTAAVGLVLLLTCANVASLLLARSVRRRREIAVRATLGAGRGALVRMLLCESLVLAGAGGVVGLALAWVVVRGMVTLGPPDFALSGAGIDGAVLLYTLIASLLSGALFGLVPALRSSRLDLRKALREGTQGSPATTRLRCTLVVAEFAVALVLLAGAGLLLRTIAELQEVDPGFDTSGILSASIALPEGRYPDPAAAGAFFAELLSRLAATPGIEAVATTTSVPFSGEVFTSIFNVEGWVTDGTHPRPWAEMRVVSPGLDRVLRLAVLEGRFFDRGDTAQAQPVVVVDPVMAERFWPGDDPVGKRITFNNLDDPEAVWFTVVGVVAHSLQRSPAEEARAQVYFCSLQGPNTFANLLVRTRGELLDLVATVREVVLSIDPAQPIADIATVEDLMTASIGDRSTTMRLLSGFAVLAVLLAALGIYGIMSNQVAERRREIGVRMSCGATAERVLGMFLGNGVRLAALGTVFGLAGVFLLGRWIRSQLFAVSPFDPATLATVTLLVLAVAALSTLVPALRASRSDPVVCLRLE